MARGFLLQIIYPETVPFLQCGVLKVVLDMWIFTEVKFIIFFNKFLESDRQCHCFNGNKITYILLCLILYFARATGKIPKNKELRARYSTALITRFTGLKTQHTCHWDQAYGVFWHNMWQPGYCSETDKNTPVSNDIDHSRLHISGNNRELILNLMIN